MSRKSGKAAGGSQKSRLTRTPTSSPRQGFLEVLLPALLSSLVLWAAFPPLSAWVPWLSLLAWLAPWGWLVIILRKDAPGGVGYWALWLSGCVFWLLILHGIRLAFWPLYFGWLALSLYLAVYVPLLVGFSRVMVHRLHWPLWLAVPTCWLGLDLVKAYLLTGYAANTLAHSQVEFPVLLQLADQIGGGGITFLMVMVSAAGFELVWPRLSSRAGSVRVQPDPSSGEQASVDSQVTGGGQATAVDRQRIESQETGTQETGTQETAAPADEHRLSDNCRHDSNGERAVGGRERRLSSTKLANVAKWLRGRSTGRRLLVRAAIVTLVPSVLCGYGVWRMWQADRMFATQPPLLTAALIQENTPTMFESDPQRNEQAWSRYLEATRRAGSGDERLDLVVWPESTFTANVPWMEADLSEGLPEELQAMQYDRASFSEYLERSLRAAQFRMQLVLEAARGRELNTASSLPAFRSAAEDEDSNSTRQARGADSRSDDAKRSELGSNEFSAEPAQAGPYLLLGCNLVRIDQAAMSQFNSALWVDPVRQVTDHYNKMHLVMFGEYIPLEPVLGWMGSAFGFRGIDAGRQVRAFQLEGIHVAPNICFESMMPRLVAWQVRQLTAQGDSPAVLVNLTNDSWFRGSSMLDHHLACSRLVAIENRRPLLVAANTGISAHIDGCGRLLDFIPRSEAGALIAEPHLDSRAGLVQRFGHYVDWLAALVMLAAFGWANVTRQNK